MFSNHFHFSKILVKHIMSKTLDSIWNCVLEFLFNLIFYFFLWNQNLNTTASTFLVKHFHFWNRTNVRSLRGRTSDNNATASGLSDILTNPYFHLQRKSTPAVSTMRFKNTSTRSTDASSGLAVTNLKPFKSRVAQNDANIFGHNSPADWGRELIKPSKNAERLVYSIERKLGNFRFEFFCGWHHNEFRFMPFWPTSSGPGTQLQEGTFFKPCSGLFCPYMANELEAWWKHTTNDRFKVSLPIADCFMWSFMQDSQNLHTFCIYEVRGRCQERAKCTWNVPARS